MLTVLFTLTFWKRIGWVLARTAAAALVPFVPALLANPTSGSTWLTVALTVGFILVLTIATKLASLPDESGMPWWLVALTRGLRQFGQMIVAGTAGAVILSDVQWGPLLHRSLVAAATTLILAAVDAIPKTLLAAPVGINGVATISSLPAAAATGLAPLVPGLTVNSTLSSVSSSVSPVITNLPASVPAAIPTQPGGDPKP